MNKKFIIAFLLLTLVCWAIHELTHHLVGWLACGEFGYLTFNKFWQKNCYPAELIAVAAGPLVSYILIWAGLLLLLKSKRYNLLGYSLILASGPFARLIAGFTKGDESNFGTAGILISIFLTLPPLIFAYQVIANKNRMLVFLYFLIILPIILVAPIILFDNFFLVPALTAEKQTGNTLISAIFGIPIIILVFYFAVFIIFFTRYLKYLLPDFKNNNGG